MPARRRAVGLGQEHARPRPRRPRPARVPGGVARQPDRGRARPGDGGGRRCRGQGRARVPGSREPARDGAGRGRRRVRAREPRLAARRDAAPACPRRSLEVGLGGLERRRTTKLSGGQQQRLALAGALAAATRGPRARRADRQPRPAGRARLRRATRGAAPVARRDHRHRRAPGRRRVAHRGPGARTRIGRAPDRLRTARRRAGSLAGAPRRGRRLGPRRGRLAVDRGTGCSRRRRAGHPHRPRRLVRV